MMPGYSRIRLELLGRLAASKAEFLRGRPWTLDPGSLRFKHGESLSELKLPYHMGGEDEACVEEAVLGFASILCKRYEPKKEGSESSPMLLPIGVLKDKTFRTDLFIADSLEKEIAAYVLKGVPYVDSAILANWLGSEGHGRKFVKWVTEYFGKMMKEEARAGAEERTAYLALLALINTVRKKKDKVKALRVKGLSYEKLDLATGLVIFITLSTTLEFFFRRLRESGASSYSADTELLLSSALVPGSFLAIPASIVSTTLNPYALSNDTFQALSAVLPGLDEDSSPEELLSAAAAALSKDAAEAVREQHSVNRFRQESLAYLAEFDLPGLEVQSMLYELYNEDRLIKNFLIDQKALASLTAALEDVKKRYARDQARTEIVDSFIRFLGGYRKGMLGGFLKGPRKTEEDSVVLEGYYACIFDNQVELYSGPMMGCLADRREELKNNVLVEEYNRGRLYRFSTDDRPVLKTLALEEEGQLFIDMKDFSRKTIKVKEIAMADFMREHFYRPILNAAGRYSSGTGVSADERGIRLTNLPGDAAIFSGGVTNLVSLAKDIQQIIRGYREELLKRLPPKREEELLDEVHKRFAAKKAALRVKRVALNQALAANEPGVESRLVALGEEEHRLESTYREELENAIRGELEAGLYIAYGTKAENMTIESRLESAGPVSVSIGGKINEASRGTFRNPLVRAKLERLLAAEKTRRKNNGLRYPFDVYIDRVFSIKLPPELDSAFEKLISARKDTNAKAMTQIMSNEFLSDLNRIISGEPFSDLRVISSTTDIYNKGEALSINALEAYMKEARGSKWFFNRKVHLSELNPSITEEFFLPFDPLEFWFGYEPTKGPDRIEAFCRMGEVIFKGFEASTPMMVYELINPEGDFFKALSKHHFQQWLEESRRTGATEGV